MSVFDAISANLEDNLKDPGWGVIGVGAGDGVPTFAYTIGLWQNYHHPEIITLGLPVFVAHTLLNTIGDRVKGGETIREGGEPYTDLANYPFVFVGVPEHIYNSDFFNVARVIYREKPFKALQMIWTDPQGYFPWHPDYSIDRRIQNLMGDN